MCGIAGRISFSGKGKKNRTDLMLSELRHRGPDGVGRYNDDLIGFGMRRLSIIDIAGGDQPLYNEDKGLVIVGNGEIYNYIELSKLLRDKGHRLRTGSDIEVALHMYEEFGNKALAKLRGMFALAIYDKRKQKLILVRDRFGEKPLYYGQDLDTFFFSSELRSILVNIKNPELNLEAVDLFCHYYFVREPLTVIKGIHKLEAGTSITIDLASKKITEYKYWTPEEIEIRETKNLQKKILDTLEEACYLTLRADVQVGLALSGGIDSSAILALSAPQYKNTLTAFSVGYKGRPETDERLMARQLAKKYKVDYFESEIDENEAIRGFAQLVYDCDEPIADIAAHSIRSVYRLAHKNMIKVILGGIGGDELFWGYPSTIQAAKSNSVRHSSWRRLFGSSGYLEYHNPDPMKNDWLDLVAGQKLANRGDEFRSYFRYGDDLKSDRDVGSLAMNHLRENWLKGNCITINDRLSMSASVELRSPFLDYKLAEIAYGSSQIVSGFRMPPKYYLKESLRGILPDEILNRPKRGFTPPVGKWLKGIIKGYDHLIKDGFLVDQRLISGDKLKLYLETAGKIPTNWYSIYQLIILEIWSRENLLGIKPQNIAARK